MIVYKGQKDSKTERRSSTKKLINISTKANFNNTSIYMKKPHIIKRNDIYTSMKININNDEYNKKIRIDPTKNSQKDNNNEKKANNTALKINLKDIINKTKNSSESNIFYPSTGRFDRSIKERYLSKFFNEKFINNFQNIKKNDNKRNHSKKNKFRRNSFIKSENNKNVNDSYMIRNQSTINLENEINFEFEIKVLEKKLKNLQKTNNKLKVKIFNIKTEQTRYEQVAKKEKIINKIIEIYNHYIKKNKSQTYNKISLPHNSSTKNFKNIILNIIDMKFNYENKLMIEQFYSAMNSCLSKSKEIILKNCIKEIKILLKKRVELIKKINEMKLYYEQNKIYQIYFNSLCKSNNFQNLIQLNKFLSKSFYKFNNNEYKEMHEFKNIVLQNNMKEKIISNKEHKLKNEFFNNKARIRKNISAYDINSRNTGTVYDFSKDPLIGQLYFTYGGNRQNNEYFQSEINVSGSNKDNFNIKSNNISTIKNNNIKILNKNHMDMHHYIKSATLSNFTNEIK